MAEIQGCQHPVNRAALVLRDLTYLQMPALLIRMLFDSSRCDEWMPCGCLVHGCVCVRSCSLVDAVQIAANRAAVSALSTWSSQA